MTSPVDHNHHDGTPIAALASGPGPSAVSIIRISGHALLPLVNSIIQPKSAQKALETRRPRLCLIKDPSSGETLDEALVLYFQGPASFTGEDVIEIQCHGGPYIVSRILTSLFKNGVRHADPGEFTKRAFLNGKMDLTESEGIRDLVNAQSHQQWIAARHLSTGKLRDQIETLRNLLIEAMAYLEAQIDFPDEGDTAHLHIEHVKKRTDQVKLVLEQLLSSYQSGKVATRGLSVALYGEPNAGKSTLMNYLLKKERAIVTPIAGTTRDYLEEQCLINGRLIRLIDMAGIRSSSDTVETMGIDAAKKIAKTADLLLVLSPSDSAENAILSSLAEINPKEQLLIATKSDLGTQTWSKDWLKISCATGENLDQLSAAIAAKVDSHINLLPDDGFITTERHKAAVEGAISSMELFYSGLSDSAHEEMLAFELLAASRHLKDIVGEVSGEDILDKIFSEFCLGK
jgi:tRNA modification GTPase